uniref:Uncharacterized protein n=1 Tax=Cacopsylla melanoneura TaxID=428564 RepID=A0A8D9BJJ2_9HEMI
MCPFCILNFQTPCIQADSRSVYLYRSLENSLYILENHLPVCMSLCFPCVVYTNTIQWGFMLRTMFSQYDIDSARHVLHTSHNILSMLPFRSTSFVWCVSVVSLISVLLT